MFFFATGEDVSVEEAEAEAEADTETNELNDLAGKGFVCSAHPIPGNRLSNTDCFAEIWDSVFSIPCI